MKSAAWLRSATNFPEGGIQLTATYKRGSCTSHVYIPHFDPVFGASFGGSFFPGSLNLWCDAPVDLPSPANAFLIEMNWQFVPIVLADSEVGLVARRPDQDRNYLEVFACHKLVDTLRLAEGEKVNVRLLSGEYLGLAA